MQKTMPVLVTTEYRGIFFGRYIEERDGGRTIVLEGCRNCIRWGSSVKGFLGLAANGPDDSCRIGPAAPKTTLYGVTSVSECSAKAIEAWEKAPWS